jgi:hypothetical protein
VWNTVWLGADTDGAGGPSPGYFNGDIYELRVWGAEATDQQRDEIFAYLVAKWGST